MRVIKSMLTDAVETMGSTPLDTQIWVYLKSAIRNHPGLDQAFSGFVNDMELDNLAGSGRKSQIERYPILLIYPNGIETYQFVSYILETSTRLSIGLEPMLHDWALPYQDQKLGKGPGPAPDKAPLQTALSHTLRAAAGKHSQPLAPSRNQPLADAYQEPRP